MDRVLSADLVAGTDKGGMPRPFESREDTNRSNVHDMKHGQAVLECLTRRSPSCRRRGRLTW